MHNKNNFFDLHSRSLFEDANQYYQHRTGAKNLYICMYLLYYRYFKSVKIRVIL